MKTLKDFKVANKKVLVRCDFNVPSDSQGNILDFYRIEKSLPTIKYLIENKAKVILMAHLDPESTGVADKKYNLDKVKKALENFLSINIIKSSDCIGKEAKKMSSELKEGQVMLLENLKFHKEEFDNDFGFAKELSELADYYVNDAFSVCHRDYASISGVPKFLEPSAGLLLEKEIESLDKTMKNPERPMTVLVGGKKVETKSKFIDKILQTADFVIVSGLIKKEIDDKNIKFENSEKIFFSEGDLSGLDINEETIKMFSEKILQAKTILWNGPFGKFEEEQYAKGTLAIANAIIKSKAYSVVGGGETVEFLNKHGLISEFSHVSTGGGAMLAYLAGEELPGIAALER